MGNEKKNLLRNFPEHFPSLLQQGTARTVQKIWKVPIMSLTQIHPKVDFFTLFQASK